MAEEHAFDRYKQANANRKFSDQHLKDIGARLIKVGQALQSQPFNLPMEGRGEWSKVRTQPNVFQRSEWTDYDALLSAIQSYEDALKQEQRAWGNLNPSDQEIIKRD